MKVRVSHDRPIPFFSRPRQARDADYLFIVTKTARIESDRRVHSRDSWGGRQRSSATPRVDYPLVEPNNSGIGAPNGRIGMGRPV
jgi:hypothetical protein